MRAPKKESAVLPNDDSERAIPRRAAVALCVLLAGLYALTPIQALQYSDSIVPVLVSTVRWLPFYWGQNRFGMLVPGLTAWVMDPSWNLIAQVAVNAGLSFVGIVGLGTVLTGDHLGFLSGLATLAVFQLFLSPKVALEFFTTPQPYGPALGLGILGLLLIQNTARSNKRVASLPWIGACLLILFSCWINTASPLSLSLLVFIANQSAERPLYPRFVWPMLLLVQATALGLGKLFPDGMNYTGMVPAERWLTNAWNMGSQFFREAPSLALGVWLVFGLVLAFYHLYQSRSSRRAFWKVFGLPLVALGLLLIIGANAWVDQNQAPWRYGILPFFLLLAWPGTLISLRTRGTRQVAIVLSVLAFLNIGMLVTQFGAPSFSHRKSGPFADPQAQSLLTQGCSVLGGDYWKVWPLVTAMNQLLHEQGISHPVLGYTTRWEGQGPLIQQARTPHTRWCEIR